MSDAVTRSILVKAPVEEVFALWENFENFPFFMKNITSVTRTGDRTSRWVMEGPMGFKVIWEAETTMFEPNKRIAWNSRDHGDITTSGQVTFNQLGNDDTEITVTMRYVPPAGVLGQLAARLFDDPEAKLEEDLRNFKSYIETRTRARVVGGGL